MWGGKEVEHIGQNAILELIGYYLVRILLFINFSSHLSADIYESESC